MSSSKLRPCRDGLDCILYDSTAHCSMYSHPCRFAHRCNKKDTEPYLTHESNSTQHCKSDTKCLKIDDPRHRARFWHSGKPDYLRACRDQPRCSDNSFEHRSKYSHGEYKQIFNHISSTANSLKYSSCGQTRSRSRGRSHSHSRSKSRGRSQSHSRSKSRGRSQSHSRSKSRGRSRRQGKSKGRVRSKSQGRSRSHSRSKSQDRKAGLNEREVFKKTIYAEARGEPLEGQQWVAWVIKNRARLNRGYWGGGSIKGVCLQPGQFECWNGRSDIEINDRDAYQQISRWANRVFDADPSQDPTGSADHYNNPDKEGYPPWTQNCQRLRKIANHQFYKGR